MSDDPDKLKAKGAALWVELAQARAELSRLRESLEFSRAGNKTLTDIGASVTRDLAAERKETARLRTALERIAEYEMNWAAGPSENLNNVQAIAEAALTPTTGGAPAMCASWCGEHWDLHNCNSLATRTTRHASSTDYEGRGRCFCAPACRDAGRPLNPAPALSPAVLTEMAAEGYVHRSMLPPTMLVTFPDIRRLPYRVARYRPDGWPICPHCDQDELYSLDTPASTNTITGCYRCGPCGVKIEQPAASPEKGTAACEICGGDGKKSESDPIYRGWSYCTCPAGQALSRPLNPPCTTCAGSPGWVGLPSIGLKPCPTCRPTPETPR